MDDINYEALRETVARAICSAVGRDPDAAFTDRHGRPAQDIKEWERWGGEAGAAIRAMHQFLMKADHYYDECEECGVGHTLEAILRRIDGQQK